LKFRRQHPIGPFFADFACAAKKLVIEIDGEHHAFQTDADEQRILEQEGCRVVRFWANRVVSDPEGTWAEIEQVLKSP